MPQPTQTVATKVITPTVNTGSPSPTEVRAILLGLTFPEYVATVASLLEALGYRNVRPLGPLHEKGRNSYGGMDITADQGQGLTSSKVVVQAKLYRGPVPRTFIDEIRGTMLRTQASQGIIVTTSRFAPSASEAALSGQRVAPVRLVDGWELSRLIATYRIALPSSKWKDPVPPSREWPGRKQSFSTGKPPTGRGTAAGCRFPLGDRVPDGATLRVTVTLSTPEKKPVPAQ